MPIPDLRDRLAADPHRPAYHFLSGHWMNDPKPFFHNGEYHVFFQHNPEAAGWGNMRWGHTVSRDLAHWTPLPIALEPQPGGPDAEGCWTGSVVRDGDRFHILYTGIPRREPLKQIQCLASSADLITWERDPANPVISEAPDGYGPCFRDPCVWRDGDGWAMLIGSEVQGQGGAVLLYRSTDLRRWESRGPFFSAPAHETGFDMECPDFFTLDGHPVLLTSRNQTWWRRGEFSGDRFTGGAYGMMDGGCLYAAKTLVDDRGRRILFGWVRETRPDDALREAGWGGVLSLPRTLALMPDGTMGSQPVKELEALRGKRSRWENLTVTDGFHLLEDVQGDSLELSVTFGPGDAETMGVSVRCSPDGVERSDFTLQRRDDDFRMNGTPTFMGQPMSLSPNADVTLRLFVDRSVVEGFAGGRAHTLRTYPTRADATGIGLFATGGRACVKCLEVWEMNSIGLWDNPS